MVMAIKGDRDLLRKLVETFLEQRASALAELREAERRNDVQALARAAHRIRGTVTLFRAATASELARSLEEMAEQGDLPRARGLLVRLAEEMEHLARFLSEFVGFSSGGNPESSMP